MLTLRVVVDLLELDVRHQRLDLDLLEIRPGAPKVKPKAKQRGGHQREGLGEEPHQEQ